MTYSVQVCRTAEKQLERLPDHILRSVRRQISMLADDPRPHDVRKLIRGLGWRIRVGDWRIIYEIDDDRKVVTVAAVKSRQSAYK